MSKEGKEESREKLIRELQDLGQLIAPNDSLASAPDLPSEPAPLPTPLTEAFDDASARSKEVDAPEGPETVDMFVADDPSQSTFPATHGDAPEEALPSHELGQGAEQDQETTQAS